MIPSKDSFSVYFFFEGSEGERLSGEIAKELHSIFGITVKSCIPLFPLPDEKQYEELATRLVLMRIINPFSQFQEKNRTPTPVELQYEKKRIVNNAAPAYGVPYDGFEYAVMTWEIVNRKIKASLNTTCIVITDQLLMTYDENDLRYHARYLILWQPSVISIGGLVEGPAKPRSYYLDRLQMSTLAQADVADAIAKVRHSGKYLAHGDPRIAVVAAGCALQAIFYQLLGEGFCSSPECRLYNFHFQEDLIRVHASRSINLCDTHHRMLNTLISGKMC